MTASHEIQMRIPGCHRDGWLIKGIIRPDKTGEAETRGRPPCEGRPLFDSNSALRAHQLRLPGAGRFEDVPEPLPGDVQAASLILNGHRQLSKSHIRKLAAHFKVSPALFLGTGDGSD